MISSAALQPPTKSGNTLELHQEFRSATEQVHSQRMKASKSALCMGNLSSRVQTF